jgi:transposase
MERIPRRVFTAEFKMEAVKLVTEQGLSMAEAARRLDIASTSLHGWMRQAQSGTLKPDGKAKPTPEQQRIRELERELAIVRMERDILKKATAYFAKESK